jgi:hypothetical protein
VAGRIFLTEAREILQRTADPVKKAAPDCLRPQKLLSVRCLLEHHAKHFLLCNNHEATEMPQLHFQP